MGEQLFYIVEAEVVPRQFCIFVFVHDIGNVYEKREVLDVNLSQFCFSEHCFEYTAADDCTFQRNSCQYLQGFILAFSFAEQNAEFTGASSIYGNIEVADAEDSTVALCTLYLQQLGHFLGCLIEGACL